jgi:hypothetical protein
MGGYALKCCPKDDENANFNLQVDFKNETEECKINFY